MASIPWKLNCSFFGLLFSLLFAAQATAHPGHGEAELLHHGVWDIAGSWLVVSAAAVIGIIWLGRRFVATSNSQR